LPVTILQAVKPSRLPFEKLGHFSLKSSKIVSTTEHLDGYLRLFNWISSGFCISPFASFDREGMATYRITFGGSATLDNRIGDWTTVLSGVHSAGLVALTRPITPRGIASRCGFKTPKLGN
jgi:hypothetical protein